MILIPLAKRFGIATVLGYLFTGLLLGPSFLKVAGNPDDLLHFSEFGVVLLLFIIGLELQPSRLWALRQQIFVLGGLQVIVTGVVLMLLSWYFLDIRLSNSFVIGFGLALSSTAFVLQLLGKKSSFPPRMVSKPLLFYYFKISRSFLYLPHCHFCRARKSKITIGFILPKSSVFLLA